MTRPRLAIVGTGIAGLGCAHFLHDRHELAVFDVARRPGGHSHTIDVREGGRTVAFDTGFMVFNRVTYPRLTRLFRQLEVPVEPTDMSFSVQHRPSGLEYCGSSLAHLFAQRANLIRPGFYRLLLQVDRFNREAIDALDDPEWRDLTVGEYVRRRGYGDGFLDLYLIPMSGAVWSTPPGRMPEFPVATLLRFFHNHGFLGLHTQHPWWTVTGGSREYVRRLVRPFAGSLRLGEGVAAVRRGASDVEVVLGDGRRERFDRVILACHADQALALMADADPAERALLGEFAYQPNEAVVHTDSSVMPRTRRAWAAWNYRIEPAAVGDAGVRTQTVYWMNRLQGVSDRANYFVSINGGGSVDPARVVRRIDYEHPLFTLGAIRAQPGLRRLNAEPGRRVFLAGSYFRYGFHEDALGSALDLARVLTGEDLFAGIPSLE